jgi:hypothetical protein
VSSSHGHGYSSHQTDWQTAVGEEVIPARNFARASA